jgi:hypothetical protein
MPSVSKKQHNFMAAVANNPKFAKKVGIPRSVGEEFLTADKGKKFKEGGEMKNTAKRMMFGGVAKGLGGMADAARKSASSTQTRPTPKTATGTQTRPTPTARPGQPGLNPDAGARLAAAKQAIMGKPSGQQQTGLGSALKSSPAMSKNMGKTGSSLIKNLGMKSGGMAHSDVKMDKKVVKKAVGMHEKQLHGGKKSDMSKLKSGGMAKGGGCEIKGKTKGTMIKMKKGGSC